MLRGISVLRPALEKARIGPTGGIGPRTVSALPLYAIRNDSRQIGLHYRPVAMCVALIHT